MEQMSTGKAEEVILALRGEARCLTCRRIVSERLIMNSECSLCWFVNMKRGRY